MTNQFIHEEISMLFCSVKFHGGWWHCNYSFKLQVQVSWRFEIDLGPGPELDNIDLDSRKGRGLSCFVQIKKICFFEIKSSLMSPSIHFILILGLSGTSLYLRQWLTLLGPNQFQHQTAPQPVLSHPLLLLVSSFYIDVVTRTEMTSWARDTTVCIPPDRLCLYINTIGMGY